MDTVELSGPGNRHESRGQPRAFQLTINACAALLTASCAHRSAIAPPSPPALESEAESDMPAGRDARQEYFKVRRLAVQLNFASGAGRPSNIVTIAIQWGRSMPGAPGDSREQDLSVFGYGASRFSKPAEERILLKFSHLNINKHGTNDFLSEIFGQPISIFERSLATALSEIGVRNIKGRSRRIDHRLVWEAANFTRLIQHDTL